MLPFSEAWVCPAVKKVCSPQEGHCEKRCEIKGGGQEMAVMVG